MDNIRELWKISYRSCRILRRETNKFLEYLDGIPVCKGKSLNRIGQLYGVKRKWWVLEGDKKYKARILSSARVGGGR